MFVRGLRGVVLSAGLLILLAQPATAEPSPSPAAAAPQRPLLLNVYQWIDILPAPPTPAAFTPPNPRLAWPLRGTITQPFGCTNFELEHGTDSCPGGYHTGLDLAEPEGYPIRAAAPGLAYPLPDPVRYGNHVIIQHLGGLATVYAHLARNNVGWGQAVATGDVIGWVGSTGNSSGPHLHFEARFAGVPLDPLIYLTGSPPDPAPLPRGWAGAPPDDFLGRR